MQHRAQSEHSPEQNASRSAGTIGNHIARHRQCLPDQRHPKSVVAEQSRLLHRRCRARSRLVSARDYFQRLGNATVDALADEFNVIPDSRPRGQPRPTPVGPQRLNHHGGTKTMSGSMPIRPANRTRPPTRRQCRAEVPDARPPGAERPRRTTGGRDPVHSSALTTSKRQRRSTAIASIRPREFSAWFLSQCDHVRDSWNTRRRDHPASSANGPAARPRAPPTAPIVASCPMVPSRKKDRAAAASMRKFAPKLSPRLVQKPAPMPTQAPASATPNISPSPPPGCVSRCDAVIR